MILIYWKWKVGSAVASLCEQQGLTYEICDDSDAPISFEKYEYIIPSPWIPSHHRVHQSGKVLAELDFAYQFLPKDFQIVAITGTDGKSTTSWIMYNILEKEFSVKKPIYLSGNFDIPFSATVQEILKKWERKWIIVVEISSFMSYAISKFRPDYSVFTNFTWDHLNWHGTLQEYLDAKMMILKRTKKKSMVNKQILDFSMVHKLTLNLPESIRIYSDGVTTKDRTDGEKIVISGRQKYRLSDTWLMGYHNAMNILSVCMVANEMKICSKRVREYLSEINGLPHRLELVGTKWWITIIEDSKSTSSQSLEAALSSFGNEKNILLIAWGSDKGDSFDFLSPRFRERVKAMACIGATKSQFETIAQRENIQYMVTDSMEESVDFLYSHGVSGDILLLSPGCASFWLFRDYLDRANQFREAIKNQRE